MAVGKLTVFFVLCLIFGMIFTNTEGAFILHKRSTEENNKPKMDCENNAPCGWAVYTPFTRRINYFMQNSCVCPEGKSCIRTDDDISVSAFVYRCRVPSNPSTTTSSTTTKSS